jgi:hypothetical protein
MPQKGCTYCNSPNVLVPLVSCDVTFHPVSLDRCLGLDGKAHCLPTVYCFQNVFEKGFQKILTHSISCLLETVGHGEVQLDPRKYDTCPHDKVAALPVSKRGKRSLDMLHITNKTSIFCPRAYVKFYDCLRASS